MPYVRFSKDTKFDGANYTSRMWYQVSAKLGKRMVETYPSSATLAKEPWEEETPGADDALANIEPVEEVLEEEEASEEGESEEEESEEDEPAEEEEGEVDHDSQ